jgi:rhamnosyltransferase
MHQVAVIMATYNGASFIEYQILSISRQNSISPSVYVSDDDSTDATVACASKACHDYRLPLEWINAPRSNYLSRKTAANNFYHIIVSLHLPEKIKWVALSDQDDIWNEDHLSRAVSRLRSSNALGYSSSVVAFWPSGATRLVRKDGTMSQFNHLFESPGPGCTIVLPRHVFDLFRLHLRANLHIASRIDFHDWLIFAFVRSLGGNWIIDGQPSLYYRQHCNNVLGVQMNPVSLIKRGSMVFGSWYRSQCLAIALFCGQSSLWPIKKLRRLSMADRFLLSLSSIKFRRRWRDRLILSLAFVLMRKR